MDSKHLTITQVPTQVSRQMLRSNFNARLYIAGTLVLGATANLACGQAVQQGARSATITADALAYASGTNPPPTNLTVTAPASGPVSISASDYANPFSGSFVGTPPATGGQWGTASSNVALPDPVSGNFSINASAGVGYIPGSSSGQCFVSGSYTFDDKLIVTRAENFQLILSVTRPNFGYVGSLGVNLPVPSITFTGPNTTDSLAANYYVGPASAPLSVSQTYTGVLQPGTYSLDSSWASPTVTYANNSLADSERAAVQATFIDLGAVPEPSSIMGILATGSLTLSRRRRPLLRRLTSPSRSSNWTR